MVNAIGILVNPAVDSLQLFFDDQTRKVIFLVDEEDIPAKEALDALEFKKEVVTDQIDAEYRYFDTLLEGCSKVGWLQSFFNFDEKQLIQKVRDLPNNSAAFSQQCLNQGRETNLRDLREVDLRSVSHN